MTAAAIDQPPHCESGRVEDAKKRRGSWIVGCIWESLSSSDISAIFGRATYAHRTVDAGDPMQQRELM
ncbi:MAG: hypothetical protein NT059_02575 [Planctomycetota bacterium]|nr:hypothetical protein [Planctomycetota bacterium]